MALWKKILFGLGALVLLFVGAIALFISRLPDLCANTVIAEYPSPSGKLKAVGGVFEKAYGAKQAGVSLMIIPKENEKDIPADHLGLKVQPLESVEDALKMLFGTEVKGEGCNAG